MNRNETDTSTASESVEDTEDNDSEVSGQTCHISSASRSSNISKGRGSQKRSPTWNFFYTNGKGKALQTMCNINKIAIMATKKNATGKMEAGTQQI
jgi:hypothetical protein